MPAAARPVRRGLPRERGGAPWPQAVEVPARAPSPRARAATRAEASAPPMTGERLDLSGPDASVHRSANSGARRRVRHGLPRVPGGRRWPPARDALPEIVDLPRSHTARASADATVTAADIDGYSSRESVQAVSPGPTPSTGAVVGRKGVRRGLPRLGGGEPWPGFRQTVDADDAAPADASRAGAPQAHDRATLHQPSLNHMPVAEFAEASDSTKMGTGVPAAATAFSGPKREQRMRGLIKERPAVAVLIGGAGLLLAAATAVIFTRWLVSLEFVQDFLSAYPGEAHLPQGVPVGIPAWLAWQHFFNVFLMVLIIRSGLQARAEKRPPMYWSPRWNRARKISINLWFHQTLDVLWIVNGAVFAVLLFVTGQWMRVVPTTWEVFPNALSAAIQYLSLNWPTENGWVNYNSLQVLAYFTTIFVAAPLAVITGVRMSGVWPKNTKALNKAYPVAWARAVHFPVMLYFVTFIIVHVALVFATGALRNLNHMYAAQGSTDPSAHAANWTGFWIFFASMTVIIACWIAARPLILSGLARAFGQVSSR